MKFHGMAKFFEKIGMAKFEKFSFDSSPFAVADPWCTLGYFFSSNVKNFFLTFEKSGQEKPGISPNAAWSAVAVTEAGLSVPVGDGGICVHVIILLLIRLSAVQPTSAASSIIKPTTAKRLRVRVHACVSMCSCIRVFMCSCVHWHVHVSMCSCIRVSMRACSCVHVFMCPCDRVFVCPFVHPCVHEFMYPCVHMLMYSCVYVFACSCVHVSM